MNLQPPATPPERLRAVSSRQNSLVKELRRAFSQGTPGEDGAVAIEGLKLLEEAVASGLRLRALFVAQRAVARAAALLQQLPADVQALLLPDEIFDSAVATETPQGVAALLYPLAAAPEALFRTSRGAPGSPRALCADNQEPLILGCAGLQDPGNLGTILRSAEAFGASGVLCTEGTVAAANPKVARSSAGSVFRLPCVRLSMAEAVAALRRHGVRLAVTSSHAIGGAKAQPVQQVELTGPVAIFIGSEGRGVPAPLLEAADVAITIPHAEQVESLNAGIAASIVLYEAWRQRSR